MRWKQQKLDLDTATTIRRPENKKAPFLVLPKINSASPKGKKCPPLRLFTAKTAWRSSHTPPAQEDFTRPLTATLEKPQVLDIDLVTKIDMSLIRKEFLCIANLCRLPISTPKTRPKPYWAVATTSNNRNNSRKRNPPPTVNRPLSLPGGKVVQSKKSYRPCTSEHSPEDFHNLSRQKRGSVTTKDPLRMHKTQPPKTTTSATTASSPKQTKIDEHDANNNTNDSGFRTYRVSKKKKNRHTILRVSDKPEAITTPSPKDKNKLPQPCKTCGRADLPERFHSHPDVVQRPMLKRTSHERIMTPVTKSSVQKPVAIKYKSKLTVRRCDSPAKLVVSRAGGDDTTPKKVTSAKGGPRTLTCYICAREFGTASLGLHEPKCMEKWERENSSLPPHLRRKRPVKPDHALTKDEWNTYAWEASQANLVPCQNCGRTFYPDRLLVHQRSCKPKEIVNMAKLPKERQTTDTPPVTPHKPISIPCSVCGRLFGTKSIKFHEPQCLKKWHLQNDHLPPNEREPMYRDTVKETPAISKATDAPVEPERLSASSSSSASKKPPMFPCYLCGRLFSVNSIYIHEPQCLKKWRAENDKLAPNKRRPEPLKPDVKFTPDGKLDRQAIAEANWLSHLEQLVACRVCNRTFNPDRIEVHERSCKGQPRRVRDVPVEIYH